MPNGNLQCLQNGLVARFGRVGEKLIGGGAGFSETREFEILLTLKDGKVSKAKASDANKDADAAQGDADQAATSVEPKFEAKEKPKLESEGCPH